MWSGGHCRRTVDRLTAAGLTSSTTVGGGAYVIQRKERSSHRKFPRHWPGYRAEAGEGRSACCSSLLPEPGGGAGDFREDSRTRVKRVSSTGRYLSAR